MTGRTIICGTEGRCDRHDRALHGYPCGACHAEWEYHMGPAYLKTLHARSTTPAALTKARRKTLEARAAYDGPHDTTVEQAGPSGPVSRLWNALCVPDCGWSHYWLPSREAARIVGDTHEAAR